MPAARKAKMNPQTIGGPRKKLYQVLRASGVSDSAATAFVTETLGEEKKKKRKKAQTAGARQQIIAKLKEIGAKVARKASGGYRTGKAIRRKKES